MTNSDRCPDEEAPLLRTRSKTLVPWGQASLAFLSLFAEPFSSTYIFPFINQLIGELGITGGDDRKIGYYAGLIESLFFVTQALTSWQWSRLSDFIGRRPVILFGLLGLSLSSFAFGLSRTLVTLIISRCLAGLLNGNVGAMKSMLGDITDPTNMPQVFAIVPAVFCFGATIGPLYGGLLAKPQDRWPGIFRGDFWETYPYFLPCFVSGSFTFLSFLVCAIFMKESLPSRACPKPLSESTAVENTLEDPSTRDSKPVPVSTLIKTYSVMIPIANYGMLGLADIAVFALLPLFYSAPLEIGGLGFPPSTIGVVLAVFGIVDASMQALLAAKMIKRFGVKKLFSSSVLWFYPLILLFPVMSTIVTAQGKIGPTIWILLVIQLISFVFIDLSYPVIFIFVTRSAPNKQSLGTTNGLSQSLTSIARAIGPASVTSLFAASKEHNLLGGNLVYIALAMLATILVVLSRYLPDLKDEDKDTRTEVEAH